MQEQMIGAMHAREELFESQAMRWQHRNEYLVVVTELIESLNAR